MSYAIGNYGSIEDNINNPNTGSPLMDEYQRNNLRKYKRDNTSQPSRSNGTRSTNRNDDAYQARAYEQAKNQALFDSQARDEAVDRQRRIDAQALDTSQKRDDQQSRSESISRRLIENIDQRKVDTDNKFKSSESKLDRDKSIDEFTQNRYQTKANQAQNRADLEYSTTQGLTKDKQSQDAELARLRANAAAESALLDKTNNANLSLANISAATERAGQTSAVERAQLAANAQVRAALYAPRSYQGY